MQSRTKILLLIGAVAFAAFLYHASKTAKGKGGGPYTFNAGPDDLGVGVMNLAQLQFQGKPPQGVPRGPRYSARRSFAPLNGTVYSPPIQETPLISPLPDEAYLFGDFRMLPLAKGNN